MKRFLFLIALILITGLNSGLNAQTYEEKMQIIREEQERKRAEINMLEARIRTFQNKVNQTEEEYDKIYKQYQNLNNLIALQDDKIRSLEEEQMQIMTEISLNEEEIEMREAELQELIRNYKEIILYAYKNGRSSNLELLLTSESLNQMVVRSFYLKKFEEQKNKQAEVIRNRKEELSEVRQLLEFSHEKNQEIISEIQEEKTELGDQRKRQARTVESLQEERTKILADLRNARLAKENLDNVMNDLIADERSARDAENERLRKLAEARQISDPDARATEIAKYDTPIADGTLISESTLASFDLAFRNSKGNLPWPVDSRTIAQAFGRVRNPLYGTITEHPGIDIVAEASSEVRSIAEGYVYRVTPIPEYGEVVIVSHGSHYTVYGNLSEIFVNSGTVLRAGDIIGRSGTADSERGEILFFTVRRGTQWLDPITWLSRR
ncbi:murein hydrolase activator EnvC [Balneola sp. MJW-20]|uniref:murein hydrolase activator EnvC family protein n=1 Tax=Gracilimonas aurantiaca TaxID=3234185 RepID=UPI0034657DAF